LYRRALGLIPGVIFSIILCYSLCFAQEEAADADKTVASPAISDETASGNAPVIANVTNNPRNNFLAFSLYADHRARHVGDIVTIIVVESSKATKSAATQTSKKSESSGSLSDFFGLGDLPLSMGVDAGSGYTGAGSTSRSGSMEAKISAIVSQVLPNGNLLLEGTRQVTVNEDVQTITVTGIVRPQDIGPDNTILSIYLANAQIKYVGDGPTAQKPGIVTRIIQTPFHWVAGIFRKIF